jgi:hypothetical protein
MDPGSPLFIELLQVTTHSVSFTWIHEDNVVHIYILTTYHQTFPPRGTLTMSGQFSVSQLRTEFPTDISFLDTIHAAKHPTITGHDKNKILSDPNINNGEAD